MESYLKGRGFQDPAESKDSSFQGFLEGQKTSPQNPSVDTPEKKPQEKQIIYEEEGCPKVEVISEEGRPTSIVIYLPDGRLLEIDCHY